jgi:hypothetical protein
VQLSLDESCAVPRYLLCSWRTHDTEPDKGLLRLTVTDGGERRLADVARYWTGSMVECVPAAFQSMAEAYLWGINEESIVKAYMRAYESARQYEFQLRWRSET